MNNNIEKIMSVSTAVLLIAIAFTVFFSSYNSHMEYINRSIDIIDEDRMAEVYENEFSSYIYGDEVVHRVIEAKGSLEVLELQNLYGEKVVSSSQKPPEIWVNGKTAEIVNLGDINPVGQYAVKYDTDSYGNITKINYTAR